MRRSLRGLLVAALAAGGWSVSPDLCAAEDPPESESTQAQPEAVEESGSRDEPRADDERPAERRRRGDGPPRGDDRPPRDGARRHLDGEEPRDGRPPHR